MKVASVLFVMPYFSVISFRPRRPFATSSRTATLVPIDGILYLPHVAIANCTCWLHPQRGKITHESDESLVKRETNEKKERERDVSFSPRMLCHHAIGSWRACHWVCWHCQRAVGDPKTFTFQSLCTMRRGCRGRRTHRSNYTMWTVFTFE